MEIQDGFIVGIFNYCDRWCERCTLTGRCRVFATMAEFEFEQDHGPLTEPMRERQERKIEEGRATWGRELAINFDAVESAVAAGRDLSRPPSVRVQDLELETRGKEFAFRMIEWLRGDTRSTRPEAQRSVEIIARFSLFIPTKIYRALMGLADDEDAHDIRSDANGSAKVALLAVDQVRTAWKQLVDGGELTAEAARPFLDEISFLERELNKRFPRARSFVRPGFDEPDELRKLD